MGIVEFKNHVKGELIRIPKFIDNKSSLHHLIWHDTMGLINSEILKLVTINILSEKVIFRIVSNINECLDMLDEITDSETKINITTYYSVLYLWLEDISLSKELFEVTANVKHFSDVYYNNNPII
jgi:hypothetical protein